MVKQTAPYYDDHSFMAAELEVRPSFAWCCILFGREYLFMVLDS